jgi:glycosyltransferase involved in cell wall biosynthesis
MFKVNKKSILFHNPDYQCTFFYQTELQKLGWRAEIFVSKSYPESLLYSDNQILRATDFTKLDKVNYLIWFIGNFFRYKYIFYYGRPYSFSNLFKSARIKLNYDPLFILLKLCRKKIIYLPSGCRDEFTKASFSLFDNGNICRNCGIFDQCNDSSNNRNLNLVNKYADLVIGTGFTEPSIRNLKHMKWKSFDLKVFNSNIIIPDKYVMEDNGNFKILHATSLKNRQNSNKNIKGSRFVFDAISRLRSEGYSCELVFVNDVKSKEMIYLQVQADLIVDQLIYGHWGSSALEGVALGKPVICYFNEEWKNNYIRNFSIESWPFIEANTASIYKVIKNLLDNPNLLLEYSELSKDFAARHLNVEVNAKDFVKCLEQI